MLRFHVFFLSCLLCITSVTKGAPSSADTSTAKMLWQRYQSADDDATRVDACLRLMELYDETGKEQKKYAVFNTALSILLSGGSHGDVAGVYARYANMHNSLGDERYPAIIERMLRDAQDCKEDLCMAEAYKAKARWSIFIYDARSALFEAEQAIKYAIAAGEPLLRLRCELLKADATSQQHDTDRNINAISTYYAVLLAADSLENPALAEACYHHLSRFYYDIDYYDSAVAFKEREIWLAYLCRSVHGDELQRLNLELASGMLKCGLSLRGERVMVRVAGYATRRDNPVLLSDALTLLRNYYLDHDDVKSVARLYQNSYREAWRVGDTLLKMRLQAYIDDAADDTAAADASYRQALNALRPDNKFYYAYLSLFYGKFLVRTGRTTVAIWQIKEGYKYIAADSNISFNLRFTSALATYHALLHQYDSAYRYACLNQYTAHELNASLPSDGMFRAALVKQSERQRLQTEREEHHRHNRHLA